MMQLNRVAILATGLTVVWMATAVGCANARRIIGLGNDARPVTLADFAAPMPSEDAGDIAESAGAGRDDGPDDVLATLLPAPVGQEEEDDFFDAFIEQDLGVRAVLQPTRPGERIIVDSLVGHVNGRPVYADDFLEPIEDRLLRAAEQSTGVRREQEFRIIINDWLQDFITNELILADAEASLTPEQQMGLFAFLGNMYDEEIRRGGGTKSGAERRRRKAGEELDQYLGRQKDLVLVEQLRMEKIQPRVIVSWRDIEREYRRRYDEFNSPATVTLARIRLHNREMAQIDAVNRRLAAGEPFADIAEAQGIADGGRWETFAMGPGGITDIEISDTIKNAIAGLEQGQTSAPLIFGSATMWINVAGVSQAVSHSIYEPQVQLGLRNAILSRRAQFEWVRYVNSLLQGGIYEELDAMSERLFWIAMVRYGT